MMSVWDAPTASEVTDDPRAARAFATEIVAEMNAEQLAEAVRDGVESLREGVDLLTWPPSEGARPDTGAVLDAIHDLLHVIDQRVLIWTPDCRWAGEHQVRLTTDRAESSHGLPVLVIDGTVYGPADLGEHEIVIDDGLPAEQRRITVIEAARRAGYSVVPRPAAIGEAK